MHGPSLAFSPEQSRFHKLGQVALSLLLVSIF